MAEETSLGEKPYDFIPLVSKCNREERKAHDSFFKGTYSGKLILSIKALSPLHVNQGILGFNENETELVNKTMRRAGKVVIPGSSIKGVIRSIAEAVSYSCAPKLPKVKYDKKSPRKLDEALEKHNLHQCDGKDKKLCPTCSIFGMVGNDLNYKSKIKFSEFTLTEGKLNCTRIPDLSEPFKAYPNPADIFSIVGKKPGYGNERIYYCSACDIRNIDSCDKRNTKSCKTCTKSNYFNKISEAGLDRPIKFRGRKFYYHNTNKQEMGNIKKTSTYEIIMKNSIFTGSVIFENLTKEELAILAFSLGLDGSFNPKLGYAKPAFYGSIEISLEEVEDLLSRYKKQTNNSINKKFIVDLAHDYYDCCDNELKTIINKLREILDKNKNAPMWPEVSGNKVY